MMKKRILTVLLILALSAGIPCTLSACAKTPDIRDTPLPQRVDMTLSIDAAALPDTSDATEQADEDSALLFGQRYAARIFKSTETYEKNGKPVAVQRRTEYLGEDGALLYTWYINRDASAICGADGQLVYSTDADTVEATYLTEPLHWFYKDGKVACAELCFYDDENSGVAYYGANGDLLCIRTELISSDGEGGVNVSNVCYNSDYETIDEAAFRSLVPQTDADAFLYIETD